MIFFINGMLFLYISFYRPFSSISNIYSYIIISYISFRNIWVQSFIKIILKSFEAYLVGAKGKVSDMEVACILRNLWSLIKKLSICQIWTV